jgi:hypothetical protein
MRRMDAIAGAGCGFSGGSRPVPTEELARISPMAFVPRKFWPGLTNPDGTIDRRTWELGLAVAVRDGLRSGDVYLPESRRHVSTEVMQGMTFKDGLWVEQDAA